MHHREDEEVQRQREEEEKKASKYVRRVFFVDRDLSVPEKLFCVMLRKSAVASALNGLLAKGQGIDRWCLTIEGEKRDVDAFKQYMLIAQAAIGRATTHDEDKSVNGDNIDGFHVLRNEINWLTKRKKTKQESPTRNKPAESPTNDTREESPKNKRNAESANTHETEGLRKKKKGKAITSTKDVTKKEERKERNRTKLSESFE